MCDWNHRIRCLGRIANGDYFGKLTDGSFVVLKFFFSNDYVWYILDTNADLYSNCESGSFTAYSGDCTQYLHCLFGKYQVFQCAPGLHWNNVSIH